MSDKDEQARQEEKLPEGAEKASEREDEQPDVEGHHKGRAAPARQKGRKRF